jgi:hypothetical protein
MNTLSQSRSNVNRIVCLIALSITLLVINGCASFLPHNAQAISISSVPIGADLTIYNSNNQIIMTSKTPAIAKLQYKKGETYRYEIKRSGYKSATGTINYKFNMWHLANYVPIIVGGILVGSSEETESYDGYGNYSYEETDNSGGWILVGAGALGAGYDIYNGALFKPEKNQINVVLQKTSAEDEALANISIDELQRAIANAIDSLKNQIRNGATIAVLNISSSNNDFSLGLIDEVTFQFTNTRRFSIVDRQALDAIRSEQLLQYSGEVDDNTAVSLGKFVGAEIVISGSLTSSGGSHVLFLKALNVQTAQVVDMVRENVN